jgi:hypothetical protein
MKHEENDRAVTLDKACFLLFEGLRAAGSMTRLLADVRRLALEQPMHRIHARTVNLHQFDQRFVGRHCSSLTWRLAIEYRDQAAHLGGGGHCAAD